MLSKNVVERCSRSTCAIIWAHRTWPISIIFFFLTEKLLPTLSQSYLVLHPEPPSIILRRISPYSTQVSLTSAVRFSSHFLSALRSLASHLRHHLTSLWIINHHLCHGFVLLPVLGLNQSLAPVCTRQAQHQWALFPALGHILMISASIPGLRTTLLHDEWEKK